MMRPKSALFYINDMNELMDDFVAKLEGNSYSHPQASKLFILVAFKKFERQVKV